MLDEVFRRSKVEPRIDCSSTSEPNASITATQKPLTLVYNTLKSYPKQLAHHIEPRAISSELPEARERRTYL